MRASLIDVVEAAYDLDGSERAWLLGILRAARPLVDQGLGLFACGCDLREEGRFRLSPVVGEGIRAPGWAQGLKLAARLEVGAEHVRKTFGAVACGSLSERLGEAFLDGSTLARAMRLFGIQDSLGINGTDLTLLGCFIGIPTPARGGCPPHLAQPLAQIAAHLGAASRLRRWLAEAAAGRATRAPRAAQTPDAAAQGLGPYLIESAEAVLTADGKLAHATDPARGPEARIALQAAAVGLARARGALRRDDPGRALDEWRALVAGRWSLVDCFDSDGRRFVVAQRNDPVPDASLCPDPDLTPRERQVVAAATLGHGNKQIAYELGVSTSSVSTLLARASRKLGARSRMALIRGGGGGGDEN